MTPTTDLSLSIHLSIELRETGDWDILGPPERAREETGGADQWVLKRRELPGFATMNDLTSASLGYPLSVFNKNSTLKTGAFCLFYPNAKTHMPLDAGDPLVKPKGMRAYHHGRIRPDNFFGFLDFFGPGHTNSVVLCAIHKFILSLVLAYKENSLLLHLKKKLTSMYE
jgi:hypothetical protein